MKFQEKNMQVHHVSLEGLYTTNKQRRLVTFGSNLQQKPAAHVTIVRK
jgi:hypothetical protein